MADDLVGRVERLERSARRRRWSALGLVGRWVPGVDDLLYGPQEGNT